MSCCNCNGVCERGYKCPRCRNPFCSAKCFNQHKKVECVRSTASEASGSKRPREDEVHEDVALRPQHQTNDTDPEILGPRQLAILAGNSYLREVLRTKELRAMIRAVDGSRSRIDALEAAMANSPDFGQFCLYLLGLIEGSA